ncbi:MAG: NAD(P)-dependent oxidoreductase [Candidatus Omnitrophica bacterium]|nr:NAD(P)-dependent oxidoreductase [Candidatus Omnitrophota bacterium]
MNIFVTGGSGFIGRNLVEYLAPKHRIIAPAHKELELLDEDVVSDFFQTNSIDTVIHCAVKPGHRNAKDPTNQLYNNLRMFFNIARNSDRFGKMIFLSSGLAYDMRYYQPKMKERYFDSHVPLDESGLSKYVAAKYIEKSDNIVELRVFGTFGKYEDYAIRFISNAICKAIFNLPITIKQNRKFDYLYIEDLMPIIDYIIEKNPEYRAYNVTPDQSIELLALAKIVKKISGKGLSIVVKEEGTGVEYSGDNSRLKNEMDGLHFTPIDVALEKLYKWYMENKPSINKDSLLLDK